MELKSQQKIISLILEVDLVISMIFHAVYSQTQHKVAELSGQDDRHLQAACYDEQEQVIEL